MKHYKFNKFYKPFTAISAVLVIISLLLLGIKGLNLGIDFKGGTLIELRAIDKQINISSLRNSFSKMNLGDVAIKNFGNDKDFLIKFEKKGDNKSLIQNIKKKLDAYLGTGYEIRRVENVGPKVSNELLKGGLIAIAASLGAMLFYIWIRFEWQFSIGAILALFHDVLITMGIFSLFSLEVNLSIVAAILTIVGYSMNDTVVIFDRVRENLKKHLDIKIFELSNLSINETLSRTIITSLTTLLALFSIFFFGGEILKGFAFAMTLGIASGGGKNTAIGIGMWLGLIMAFNVWFVIWPNQKRALGIVECDAEVKAKSAKTAMLFSRTNTLLSLPMLLTMIAAQNLY